MNVSVIMTTGEKRPKALHNTLLSWSRITYPIEFILVDTDNSDAVRMIAEQFPFVTLQRIPPDDKSRDWARVSRAWTRAGKACSGEYVIFAMADELLGSYDVIEKFLSVPTPFRSSVLNFFMSPEETAAMDSMDWLNNPKVLEDFYDFWTHKKVEGADNVGNLWRKEDGNIATMQSHIHGAPREHWEYMNWFRTDEHGYWWLDMDLAFREKVVGRICTTVPDFCCYHQWHPLLELTPRDRDYEGYVYENEMQARLLEPAKRTKEDVK